MNYEVAGSKEEAFFDSKPWLESDDEQDFYSVNGGKNNINYKNNDYIDFLNFFLDYTKFMLNSYSI